MYLQHFGVTVYPFRLTPDIGFLFMSEAHSRAKAYMDYTVWNDEGFVVITGGIGCGKTTLIQKLISELDQNVVVAKIFQTQLNETEFLQAILVEFGLNPFNANKVELLDMLNNFLIEQFLQRKRVVLIVDDAHNLGMRTLEEIRMLAGLETRKEKILHVILVGQPQLKDILDHPEMEQLTQRVKLRYHIRALNEREHGEYIRHRLSVAGATERAIFLPETLTLLYKYTGGIPRLTNTLCDTALTCAYADNLPEVNLEVVEAAIKELQWLPYSERARVHHLTPLSTMVEGETRGMLREQSRVLAAIAEQVGKLEELSRSMESIGRNLDAIEAHLRNSARAKNTETPFESAPIRQRDSS